MKTRNIFLIATVCVIFALMTTISEAQWTADRSVSEDLGAEASLVVTAVSGPAQAILNKRVSVTYAVKNKGDAASGAYKVRLYLSSDNKTISAEDRLLATVNFDAGLAPGESRKKTSKVLIPFNGLSGNYHFGAKVGNRSRVSAKQALIVRFTVDTNGKVTDHKTDLTWQQSDDGVKKDWVSAVAYCSNLTLGGSTNWRLPSIAELQTIVDYSQTYPATDPVFACRSSNYWSSTPVTISPDYPWYINFTDGYSYWSGKSTLSYVRCVRGISW